jgi:hypothetical protein
MAIELGDKVKDTVTGYTGIAVARTRWLHGCDRIAVQPQELDKDNKVQEPQTFDEKQLDLVKPGVVRTETEASLKKKNGGPQNDKAALRRS